MFTSVPHHSFSLKWYSRSLNTLVWVDGRSNNVRWCLQFASPFMPFTHSTRPAWYCSMSFNGTVNGPIIRWFVRWLVSSCAILYTVNDSTTRPFVITHTHTQRLKESLSLVFVRHTATAWCHCVYMYLRCTTIMEVEFELSLLSRIDWYKRVGALCTTRQNFQFHS